MKNTLHCFALQTLSDKIDIGSNAIRLVISYVEQYDDDAIESKKARFVRIPIRLGADFFKRGHISSERSEALCDVMSGFAALMRAYGVREPYQQYAK